MSHPARGAWIEITTTTSGYTLSSRRTPHGVRGLKSDAAEIVADCIESSHPARGAWIEIQTGPSPPAGPFGRTPHGVRGLKLLPVIPSLPTSTSHPARGAWIEI